MTSPSSPSAASPPSSQIRLPRIATGLFIVSPILLFIGFMTAFSTQSRDYFERAVNQTTVGTVMLVVGIACLLTALVLVGIRAIAQQHLDAVLQAERAPEEQRAR